MVIVDGAGFVVVVVVSVVLSVVAVVFVSFLLSCSPQEAIQKRITAKKGVERKVEGFIVVDLKMKKEEAEEVIRGKEY